MLNKVRLTIQKYQMISPGEGVVAAVSGGADSVALLYCLRQLAPELGFRLFVVHVNHLLRGEQSDADADFVRKLAEQDKIPVAVCRIDVAAEARNMPTSKQDAARILRYQALRKAAENWGAAKIALGHHADDQAETVLLHLLRGSGPQGLVGMQPVREGRYIRPLLETSRTEIEEFCRENCLNFRTDLSNFQPVYLRNKIRLELLPRLKSEYNPGLVEGLGRLADLLREENSLIAELARKAFAETIDKTFAEVADKTLAKPADKTLAEALEKGPFNQAFPTGHPGPSLSFSLAKFAGLPKALQRRVLILGWQEISRQRINPEFSRVEEALGLALFGRTGGRLELPGGVYLEKSYTTLNLRANPGYNDEVNDFSGELPVPGELTVPEKGFTITAQLYSAGAGRGSSRSNTVPARNHGLNEAMPEAVYSIDLAADSLTFPLTVRNRRPGDRFFPLGAPGHRKLQDFLVDAKIPRSHRDNIVLVVSGEQIIWVAGMRPDESCRITEAAKTVLHLTLHYF